MGVTDFPHSPFWDFSLRVYGKGGVPEACLALQERHDLDVNMLLFCCWVGQDRSAPPRREDIERCQLAISDWHQNAVRPLRAIRRWMKEPGSAIPGPLAAELRERVKRLELDAEHIEQLALAHVIGEAAGSGENDGAAPRRAAEGLAHYFAIIGVAPDEGDMRNVRLLLEAAFPGAPPRSIDGAMRRLGQA